MAWDWIQAIFLNLFYFIFHSKNMWPSQKFWTKNKTYFGLLSNSFALAAMASRDSWSSMTFPNSSINGSSSASLSVALLESSPNFWSPLISRTFSWIWSKSAPFCTSLFFLVRFSYFFDQRYPMNKFSNGGNCEYKHISNLEIKFSEMFVNETYSCYYQFSKRLTIKTHILGDIVHKNSFLGMCKV